MLSPESLCEELHRQPFVPLRIYLTDGKTYEIRHPEMAMVTSREVYVGREETSPGSGIARGLRLGLSVARCACGASAAFAFRGGMIQDQPV